MTELEMIAEIRSIVEKCKISEEFCINNPKAAKQMIDYYGDVTLKLLDIVEPLIRLKP